MSQKQDLACLLTIASGIKPTASKVPLSVITSYLPLTVCCELIVHEFLFSMTQKLLSGKHKKSAGTLDASSDIYLRGRQVCSRSSTCRYKGVLLTQLANGCSCTDGCSYHKPDMTLIVSVDDLLSESY